MCADRYAPTNNRALSPGRHPYPPRFLHVSRRHAEIWADERQQMYIRDLASTGGSCVNGIWIDQRKPVLVNVGDHITLAGLELSILEDVSVMAQVLSVSGELPELDQSEQEIETLKKTATEIPLRFLLTTLSQAELEILLWIQRGYFSDGDLGRWLHRSPNTVRTQMASIMKKLGVNSRTEIYARVRRMEGNSNAM